MERQGILAESFYKKISDQEASRDDLGFRCAMIRVGSPSGF